MAPRPPPPAERVRERLRGLAGDRLAAAMPRGYQRIGRVLLVRLPPELRPYGAEIGEAWRDVLGVASVLAQDGPTEGELRRPRRSLLAGTGTETEVVEHGCRWTLDAAQIMFAAGNRVERRRFAGQVRPGERVADLFAGIGYFTVPAARAQPRASFVAVEKNPVAFSYLEQNLAANGVAERVLPLAGDNREVRLEARSFDRVLLGYLPDALPWLGRAVDLVRADGGTVHVHRVVDVRTGPPGAAAAVAASLQGLGARVDGRPAGRAVKPYGPGRVHVVVDARIRPPGR